MCDYTQPYIVFFFLMQIRVANAVPLWWRNPTDQFPTNMEKVRNITGVKQPFFFFKIKSEKINLFQILKQFYNLYVIIFDIKITFFLNYEILIIRNLRGRIQGHSDCPKGAVWRFPDCPKGAVWRPPDCSKETVLRLPDCPKGALWRLPDSPKGAVWMFQGDSLLFFQGLLWGIFKGLLWGPTLLELKSHTATGEFWKYAGLWNNFEDSLNDLESSIRNSFSLTVPQFFPQSLHKPNIKAVLNSCYWYK